MNTNQPAQQPAHLDQLAAYITGLWKLGGMPLVLIGLGAINLTIPLSENNYTEAMKILTTSFLFLSSVITWATVTLIAYKRWQYEMELNSRIDAKVIESVVKLAESTQSDAAAKDRVKTLTDSLDNLGVRAT